MSTLLFKNNASTTLNGSINNTQTSITVTSGATFPTIAGSDYFYATMYEVSGNPAAEINIEIVKVTAVSGNVWTIVRAQDGTTARSRDGVTTCYIENRLTAASAALMLQKDNNLSDVTSVSTSRTNLGLGTIATQDASNVNITGGTITGVTINSLDSTTNIIDNGDNTKKVNFEVSGVSTGTTRTLTVPNASGTIALTSDLTSGYQPLDADLTALAALASTGIVARTSEGTVATRTLTPPAAGITVSNGDGVSGNPTLALANDLAAVEAISTTGFVKRTAADTWTAASIVNADVPAALSGKTYDGLTLTANATGFSAAGGTTSKTLTVSNSITLAGTDGTTITLPATSGTVPLNNQTFFVGTTQIAINRTSASQTLSGVNIDGSAGSATSATSATTSTNLASGVLGSVPYQSAAATTALLAPNTTTTRNFLRMTGTGAAGAAPAWDTVTKTDVGLSNVENTALSTWAGSANITTLGTVATGTWNATTIGISKGGTGATTAVAAFDALSPATTLGDLIYSNGTDNVRLAGNTTTNRRFLRQTGTGTVSAAPAWDGLLDADIPSALTGKTYNALTLTAAATGFTIAGGTTSKTLTVSNTLTLAGTDSSTLNVGAGGTLGSAAFTASTAYAPAAGSTSIVTLGTITAGTWTGSAIGISYGGTGATSASAGFNALSPVTTLGDLIYGSGANSNTRLAGNTTTSKRFLTQTGTGSASAAPGWNAIVDGDIPSALTGKTYNALNLTANATGFSVSGGTTSKTLQVDNNLTLSGTDGSTLRIGTGGITTDANGNLGVSATPSAWDNTTFNAIELNAGALAAYNYTGTTLDLVQNAYFGVGAYTYKTTGAATIYRQQSGKHFWGIASSGTAGASASFSYPMQLDNSGNLTFSGTGRRIIGDFSNGTFANQLAFQTSTTDGSTYVNIIPNGTGIASGVMVWGNQSMSNTALGALSVANGSSVTLASSKIGTGTAGPIVFSIDGNERLRIDTAGNLGLGMAPSAWASNRSVIQLKGGTTAGGAFLVSGSQAQAILGTNAYSNGTNFIYLAAGASSFYEQVNGAHVWQTAPSGTAGNAITFTQAMTLNASGNLGVGTSSPSSKFVVSNSGANGLEFDPTTGAIQVYNRSTAAYSTMNLYANTLYFRTGASPTIKMTLDSAGAVGIGTSSPAAKFHVDGNALLGNGAANSDINPSSGGTWFAFDSGSNTAIIQALNASTSNLAFHTKSTGAAAQERVRISSGGDVGIGVSPSYRLHVKGSGSTNATYAVVANNSNDTNIFAARDDGYFTIPYAYNTTTASAANVFVDGNGGLIRSTSSLRYKEEVQNATHGLAEVMQLRSVTYKGKSSFDGNKVFGGLIAEEVHAAGLTEFVDYDSNGQPDALHYGHMVALLAKAIQEQQAIITSLEARVAALEV